MSTNVFRAFLLAGLILTGTCRAAVTQYLVGFGHLAFGYYDSARTGYWTTSFIFRNDGASDAAITLHFFADSGAPLQTPVIGANRSEQYSVTIPAGGSRRVDLDPTKDYPTVVGWTAVEFDSTAIKGQAVFIQHASNGTEAEGVVPMVSASSLACMVPFSSATVYSMPFDNTPGHTSSYAFANTTNQAVAGRARFYGENNEFLGEIELNLPAFGHTAFESTTLTAIRNTKGTMRLVGAGIIPLGFRFNASSFTTWLER